MSSALRIRNLIFPISFCLKLIASREGNLAVFPHISPRPKISKWNWQLEDRSLWFVFFTLHFPSHVFWVSFIYLDRSCIPCHAWLCISRLRNLNGSSGWLWSDNTAPDYTHPQASGDTFHFISQFGTRNRIGKSWIKIHPNKLRLWNDAGLKIIYSCVVVLCHEVSDKDNMLTCRMLRMTNNVKKYMLNLHRGLPCNKHCNTFPCSVKKKPGILSNWISKQLFLQ